MEIDYRALLALTGCRYDTIVSVNNFPCQGEMRNEMTIISSHSLTGIISVVWLIASRMPRIILACLQFIDTVTYDNCCLLYNSLYRDIFVIWIKQFFPSKNNKHRWFHTHTKKRNTIWSGKYTLLNKQFNMKLRIPNPEMSYSSKVLIASIQNYMKPAIRLNLSI